MVTRQQYRNVFNTQWKKFLVGERFIRSLNNEIYKQITTASKNLYIEKIDNIVDKYNNMVVI